MGITDLAVVGLEEESLLREQETLWDPWFLY